MIVALAAAALGCASGYLDLLVDSFDRFDAEAGAVGEGDRSVEDERSREERVN